MMATFLCAMQHRRLVMFIRLISWIGLAFAPTFELLRDVPTRSALRLFTPL